MKRTIAIIGLILLSAGTLHARIGIIGKKEMVEKSDLIAIVNIQELVSTDKTRVIVDLIAGGHVSQALKGEAKGEITFRIPRFFPCAAFDVSTGTHLVFLKKDEKHGYVGVNWYMSYLYLGGKTAKWFDQKGVIVDRHSSEQVIEETKVLIKEAADVSTKGNVPADYTQWLFRARVADCRIADRNARFGVSYAAPAIKKAEDNATLVVGSDARWLVTLTLLDHGNDPLGLKHIKTLNVLIHSPTLSLGTDKPENQEFDLSLAYRVNERSEYRFTYLRMRQPEVSNLGPDEE